jgi:hypothetical protein
MREIIFAVLSSDSCSEDAEYFKNFLDLAQFNRNPKYLREIEQDCIVLSKAIN